MRMRRAQAAPTHAAAAGGTSLPVRGPIGCASAQAMRKLRRCRTIMEDPSMATTTRSAIVLPSLPYAQDALEPHMSRETLEYHYGKHHKGYVEKVNALIKGSEFEDASLEELVAESSGDLFNNAAQVWNHNFFWNCLSPRRQNPGKELSRA